MCLAQFKFAESITPRNLVSYALFKIILLTEMFADKFLLRLNMLKEVFDTFSDRRFTWNHVE